MRFDMGGWSSCGRPCAESRIRKDHWVSYKVGESILIKENSREGAGIVTVVVNNDCFFANPFRDNHPIVWALNQKCADGAIVEFCKDGVRLHIIELKKTMTPNHWNKMKQQFEGMCLNLLAFMGIAKLNNILEIRAYAAFQTDSLSARASPSPVLLKVGVGRGKTLAGVDDWQNKRVTLFDFPNIEPIEIFRDEHGDAKHIL